MLIWYLMKCYVLVISTANNWLLLPPPQLSGLSSLLHFLDEQDPDIALTVRKYTALSLLEVFNKVLPSYPIQKHDLSQKCKSDLWTAVWFVKYDLVIYLCKFRDEQCVSSVVFVFLTIPVKNETQKVYFYENHLLSGYQIYLKGLEKMLSEASKKTKISAFQVSSDDMIGCLLVFLCLSNQHYLYRCMKVLLA